MITAMPTANLTVSLDPAVIDMAKAQAAQRGMAASAWVAKLIRDAAVVEASRRYDEYNRTANDAEAMAAWDTANTADQDDRMAGAEW
jgi:ribonuclease HII